MMQGEEILKRQQTYFKSGATKSVEFRIHQLRTLKKLLTEHEQDFFDALKKDFKKSEFETYGTELGLIHTEINYVIKKINRWAKPKRVSSSIVNYPTKDYLIPEPYGAVLIISPWNYPVLLALLPLVGAIAAGNTAVIKPSELTVHTSAVLKKTIDKWFKEEFIAVREGGVEISEDLLEQNFDYIFFTGSPRVGKIVMQAAAENLTPVTLELGGKSPCIVDETADLETAAKRIAWGKFVNAGQTCVAPDYLLVQEKVRIPLLKYLKEALQKLYGINAKLSPDYPRIINDEHFDRLISYLNEGEIFHGGKSDKSERYIEPTILHDVSTEDQIMIDEIFGPILPVIPYNKLHEAIDIINQKEKPLALYLFTKNKSAEDNILTNCSFGGGAINDTIAHLGNRNLGIGGVGNSGMGSYHGKKSFETFSHYKAVMKKPFWFDIPLRYAPYKNKLNLIRRILK